MENKKLNKKKYQYLYVQFTVTSSEKRLIKEFVKKENFKTLSDFLRRVIFDYIRRQEHPELFLSTDDSNINSLVLERIAKNIQDLQDLISQREDTLEEVRRMVSTIHKVVELRTLAKEREQIITLLQKHSSLSLRQIQEETNLTEDVVFKIISDTNLFKITTTGRFALR